MLYHDTVILVFAKAPVEGTVNTRLIPDIGVTAATRLQYDLILDRLSMLTVASLCDVRLMCAPAQQESFFIQCKTDYPITLFDQIGEDLGERMFAGVVAALQKYKYCIVIGTDAPALDAEMIRHAIDELHDSSDVVIVPAEDGGYVLMAMREASDFLFRNISWGSSEVMQQTMDSLDENNVSFKAMDVCWDIDRLEDYQRYLKMKTV